MLADVVGVVIGRNEGERLRRCLESMVPRVRLVVYVDSGSTDGSVEMASALGATVVPLDMQQPFTAARARNAGFTEALRAAPECSFVQFVDGDCEVRADWLERAQAFLGAHPDVVAVCGRRRERDPQRSAYNLLCDLEWAVPTGPARSFGGDVMLRTKALREIGGYRDDLIAGEEPELSVRLRAKGWAIVVLDAEMTLHDAAMTRFGQWWTRMVRSGYAFAEGAYLHGAAPERHFVRELRSALAWGLILPLLILGGSSAGGLWAIVPALLYPVQVLRLVFKNTGELRQRVLRASFLVIGKFPETQGALRFWTHKMLHRSGSLIEYK
jgi:glycosyltransferase involved in cell wall biosynthesis